MYRPVPAKAIVAVLVFFAFSYILGMLFSGKALLMIPSVGSIMYVLYEQRLRRASIAFGAVAALTAGGAASLYLIRADYGMLDIWHVIGSTLCAFLVGFSIAVFSTAKKTVGVCLAFLLVLLSLLCILIFVVPQ